MRLVITLSVALVMAVRTVTGGGGLSAPSAPRHESRVPVTRMLGQMIVTAFSGSTPSAALLARVRAGQVGGVILFADNVSGGLPATRRLVGELQSAARRGGNPPLLVMTDQEGGEVKRLPGPPGLAPSQMSTSTIAFREGQSTGRLLRSVGVNLDLAPVADVERARGSFLGSRAFGSAPSTVARLACAFARGVASEGVGYTLKHFPGLGRAVQSTDVAPVSINASATALRTDYAAYRACGAGSHAVVMVGNASYPTLTGSLPAVMSPLTYRRELSLATGGRPVVTISDDLEAGAIRGISFPARRSVNAGLDLLLYAGSEQTSADVYSTLLHDLRTGSVPASRVRAAYAAITALKTRLR